MNRKIITAAVLAAYIGAIGAASAQDRGDRDNNRGNDRNRGDQRDNRHDGRQDGRHDDRDHDRGERRNDRNDYRHDDRVSDRGAGPRHDLRKGGRLPSEYRGRQYVVDDWRGHRLSAPPRGYHWVQTGGDYVLVAVATGIIANLLLNN